MPQDFAMPRHVGILMDGNGRWAQARGLPRTMGHKAGLDALNHAVKGALAHGVEALTLYSFSSENWSRPVSEIRFLFELLRMFVRQNVAELHANGVRVSIIGERDGLDPDILLLLDEAQALTRNNTALHLLVAFNYGSRLEIASAVRAIVLQALAGGLTPDQISPALISDHLYTAGMPDPDLIIRTGGEKRTSNFLLWQSAYSEYVFFEEFWPDFTVEMFGRALQEYSARKRRFGGLVAKTA